MAKSILLVIALILPTGALAQTTERTIAVGQGVRLNIESQHGSISVSTWDRPNVRIVARHDPTVHVEIEEAGSTLSVRAMSPRGKKVDVAYTVTVPRRMDMSLHAIHGPITVQGAGGRVEAENVKGGIDIQGGSGFVEASSVEGGVTIRDATGQISAASVNAGITITGATGTVEASTVNGSATLRGIDSRSVEATTVNGSIVYDGTIHRDGNYVFNSHNGPVTVTVPEGAGASVTVSTFNGGFSASFPIAFTGGRQGKTFSFVIGSGDAHLELQSFNGQIRLRRPGER
jgi:DUF4097 and DUF4098 domain-containing protein YvlB